MRRSETYGNPRTDDCTILEAGEGANSKGRAWNGKTLESRKKPLTLKIQKVQEKSWGGEEERGKSKEKGGKKSKEGGGGRCGVGNLSSKRAAAAVSGRDRWWGVSTKAARCSFNFLHRWGVSDGQRSLSWSPLCSFPAVVG